jgi:hypothetical protein
VNHVLHHGTGKGIQAIIIYPMNALANSQEGELRKFLEEGFESPPVTFAKYTGQESEERRKEIMANPPDILLTNYVMLELILTRVHEQKLIERAKGLRFLVLDELHTYRGRHYIVETLPIVRRKDIAAHGSYRTKDAILNIYDEMAKLPVIAVPAPKDATATITVPDVSQWQPALNPPPASPEVAHKIQGVRSATITVPDVRQYQPALNPPPAHPDVAHPAP